MYLIADIGNTRMKLAVFDKSHNPLYFNVNSYNIRHILSTLKEVKDNYKIDKVFYSSVCFDRNDIFVSSIKDVLKKDVYRVTYKDVKLKGNLYEPKDAVGIDRLLATYASICFEGYNKNEKYASIVVDMGTATTISVMTSDFIFLGGMIMSGTKTSYKALSSRTSLPYHEIGPIESIPNPLNNNTKDGIMSGAIYNTIGSVNYGVNEIKKNIKEKYNEFPTAMQGLGYKEVVQYLENKCTYEEMMEKIKQESRRYAKRQITWFKAIKELIWLDAEDGIEKNIEIILEEIN